MVFWHDFISYFFCYCFINNFMLSNITNPAGICFILHPNAIQKQGYLKSSIQVHSQFTPSPLHWVAVNQLQHCDTVTKLSLNWWYYSAMRSVVVENDFVSKLFTKVKYEQTSIDCKFKLLTTIIIGWWMGVKHNAIVAK